MSTLTYTYEFFLCEQYNFDCGYTAKEGDYLTIANGVQLDITEIQLSAITTLSTTYDKILPYIGLDPETAVCASAIFPLELTPA